MTSLVCQKKIILKGVRWNLRHSTILDKDGELFCTFEYVDGHLVSEKNAEETRIEGGHILNTIDQSNSALTAKKPNLVAQVNSCFC